MSFKARFLAIVLATAAGGPLVGCGGDDKCDELAAMCRRCTTPLERDICEDLLADLTRNPTPAGVSRSDLCAASMDAFIGTSCRR